MSAHIADAHEKTTLFYGWYSNPACAVHADRRTRGYRKQHGLLVKGEAPDPLPGPVARAPLEVRRPWARVIRMVYEVDPLLCSRCGGRMKVIAVIEHACADTCLRRSRERQAAERRPAIIRQIRSAELATKP